MPVGRLASSYWRRAHHHFRRAFQLFRFFRAEVEIELCLAALDVIFENPGDGVGQGMDSAAVTEHDIRATDTLELIDDHVYTDSRPKAQGDEAANRRSEERRVGKEGR